MAKVSNKDKILRSIDVIETILDKGNFEFGAVKDGKVIYHDDVTNIVRRLKRCATMLSSLESKYIEDYERKKYDRLIQNAINKGLTFDDIARALNNSRPNNF